MIKAAPGGLSGARKLASQGREVKKARATDAVILTPARVSVKNSKKGSLA